MLAWRMSGAVGVEGPAGTPTPTPGPIPDMEQLRGTPTPTPGRILGARTTWLCDPHTAFVGSTAPNQPNDQYWPSEALVSAAVHEAVPDEPENLTQIV